MVLPVVLPRAHGAPSIQEDAALSIFFGFIRNDVAHRRTRPPTDATGSLTGNHPSKLTSLPAIVLRPRLMAKGGRARLPRGDSAARVSGKRGLPVLPTRPSNLNKYVAKGDVMRQKQLDAGIVLVFSYQMLHY